MLQPNSDEYKAIQEAINIIEGAVDDYERLQAHADVQPTDLPAIDLAVDRPEDKIDVGGEVCVVVIERKNVEC